MLTTFSEAIEKIYMNRYGKKRNLSTWKRVSNEVNQLNIKCEAVYMPFFYKERKLQSNLVDCGVIVCKVNCQCINFISQMLSMLRQLLPIKM